jgi:hypothetical protein
MGTMKRRGATPRALLALAAAVMAATLRAQAPPEQRIPVRDPDTLAAMGFPTDAKNVFIWSGADTGRGHGKEGAALAPESWGTVQGSTTVMGYRLEPMRNVGYARYRRSIGATYCEAGVNGSEGAAPLDLPDGTSLNYFQYWAYDTDAAGDVTFDVYEDCQAPGTGGEPTITLIGAGSTAGTDGRYYDFASLNGYTVNNSNCHYSIRVLFGSVGVACVGSPLQVQKVRVAWVRQASPPPAVATFNDVPTSHPFFQFVEALAKSGITGGCGGGAYCVDQPLTRGQMAVFLAKGLGLEWP